jgi:hypothetical protein
MAASADFPGIDANRLLPRILTAEQCKERRILQSADIVNPCKYRDKFTPFAAPRVSTFSRPHFYVPLLFRLRFLTFDITIA